MPIFEEELGRILHKVQERELNIYEGIVEIETAITDCLGLSALHHKRCKQIEDTVRRGFERMAAEGKFNPPG